MKQFFMNRNAMSIFFFSLMLATTLLTGCKKDDDDEPQDCQNFTSLNQTVTMNGQTLTLTIAQRLVASSFDGDLYVIQIGAFSSDCNELNTFTLNCTVSEGAALNGSFAIKDFFDAGLNDCYGSYSSQKISPISQSVEDLKSGTVKVVDKGNKKYNFDVSATLVSGDKVTMKGDVQF